MGCVIEQSDLEPEILEAAYAQFVTAILIRALRDTRSSANRKRRRRWGTGRRKKSKGYVRIHVGNKHPMAPKSGWVREHRIVAAQMLGVDVLPKEYSIHHKRICEGGSGCKSDNSWDNLEIFANQALHTKWEQMLDKIDGRVDDREIPQNGDLSESP